VAAVVAAIVAVAAVIAVAAIVAVGASVVEVEVVAGSPLDHGEVLELLSQPWILKVRPFTVGSLYT
jgi:hypothetical protein